ncbi:MAG: M55 family metallopeptidase [Armatimonadota bacterium]|nr:M55 family metallopeptidase [Armatimonadota bacterium]MDR7528313.1 M55 family metallopeptidase [Armatimonadota bacterium]MDR7543706.1 M55 family metallopeptidase [Armatimonadota bacterium]MDR7573752.1 M55 family metallopeptidase [Armatimonadota bacterium]MDR7584674.1 M55 family metallopeptidase [Armatimonadota bacterium]
MDIYIVIDMEGISGISYGSMVRVGHKEWSARGRLLATADLNAAIEGALAAGAKRIWVKDGHDAGENLVREELHPAAELLSGTYTVPGQMPGLDESFDAVFLIGFHARMGTLHAHFDHTITTASVSEIRLNNVPVGEIGIYAAYAGIHGVPVTLVTGDLAAVREAKELLGDLSTVAVKQGYGRFSARIPSPEHIRPRITAAAREAAQAKREPYILTSPATVAIDFLRSADADMAEMVPGSRRSGARTVEYTHEDPAEVLRALQALVHLGGIAANRWAQALYTSGTRVI